MDVRESFSTSLYFENIFSKISLENLLLLAKINHHDSENFLFVVDSWYDIKTKMVIIKWHFFDL